MKTRLLSGLLIVLFLSTFILQHPNPVQAVPIDADVDIPVPTWEYTGNMHSRRSMFTLSMLPDGRVLAAGGYYYDTNDHYLSSSEIFNPADQLWYLVTDTMASARRNHTATTLLDGRVLIAGGENTSDMLNTAEIFDPKTNLWTNTPNMVSKRVGHTATRLNDGRVLVVGGCALLFCHSSTEIYDPVANNWSPATSLDMGARKNHAAALLHDGTVLVTGGFNIGTPVNVYHVSVEQYNPGNNTWTTRAIMNSSRSEHFMAVRRDGKVLVVGGYKTPSMGGSYLKSSELFDPATNSWSLSTATWNNGRRSASAILDPFDNLYLIGGYNADFPYGLFQNEVRDIDSETTWTQFTGLDSLNPRYDHAAIQLANGGFLVAGGRRGNPVDTYFNTAQIYQDQRGESVAYDNTLGDGVFISAGTLLANGDLLITGGIGDAALNGDFRCSAMAYIWSAELDDRDDLPSMAYRRCGHSATLLADGRVVVIGGYPTSSFNSYVKKIEILNGNIWQQLSIPFEIGIHTATLLPNGEILAVGLETRPKGILFNPDTLEIRQTSGSYTGEYNGHTATLLPNGKVLIYGSSQDNIMEIYDPQTDTFSTVNTPSHKFSNHTATLLPDGRVLFAGGLNMDEDYLQLRDSLYDVRIYNPTSNTWSVMEDMNLAHAHHSAVMLPDGKVAVLGGKITRTEDEMNVVEIFDLATNTWTISGEMSFERNYHKALLSPQGNLLIFGGLNQNGIPIAKLERYYFRNSPILLRQGANPMWQPTITDVDASISGSGVTYTITGEELIGDVEANSGMSRQAATNFPLIRVIRLDNQQMIWLKPDGSPSGNQYVSQENNVLAPGPVMVFDFASGSHSVGMVVLSATLPVFISYEVYLPALIK